MPAEAEAERLASALRTIPSSTSTAASVTLASSSAADCALAVSAVTAAPTSRRALAQPGTAKVSRRIFSISNQRASGVTAVDGVAGLRRSSVTKRSSEKRYSDLPILSSPFGTVASRFAPNQAACAMNEA